MALTSISSSLFPSKLFNPPRNPLNFTLKPLIIRYFPLKVSNCIKNSNPRTNNLFPQLDSYPDEDFDFNPVLSSGVVCYRLRKLVSEFRSLPEPIDRVKRLLDYAAVLPKLGESTRSPENRVPGCAAQVWLEIEVDELGRMRFGADSDSEITKGFCSCLIFLLDGAYPEEILKVRAEDLADMNVGLPVRSRVNSWNNVLISMQERTKSFAAQRQEIPQLDPLEPFPSLVISDDSIISKGDNLFCKGRYLFPDNFNFFGDI